MPTIWNINSATAAAIATAAATAAATATANATTTATAAAILDTSHRDPWGQLSGLLTIGTSRGTCMLPELSYDVPGAGQERESV